MALADWLVHSPSLALMQHLDSIKSCERMRRSKQRIDTVLPELCSLGLKAQAGAGLNCCSNPLDLFGFRVNSLSWDMSWAEIGQA